MRVCANGAVVRRREVCRGKVRLWGHRPVRHGLPYVVRVWRSCGPNSPPQGARVTNQACVTNGGGRYSARMCRNDQNTSSWSKSVQKLNNLPATARDRRHPATLNRSASGSSALARYAWVRVAARVTGAGVQYGNSGNEPRRRYGRRRWCYVRKCRERVSGGSVNAGR